MPSRTDTDPQAVFRIAFFVDLAPGAAFASAPSRAKSAPLRVRKDGLSALYAANATSVAIEVDDPFLDEGKVPLVVRIKDPKSFRPDLLAEDQPELRSLLGAHAVLREAADGKITIEDARARVARTIGREAWATEIHKALAGDAPAAPAAALPKPAAPAPATASVASLLDKVDVDAPPAPAGPTSPTEKARMSSIIAAVARGKHDPGARRPDVGRATRLVERGYRLLLERVLAHPEIRRLGSSWHAVRWLVERASSDAVEIEVVSGPASGIAAAFEEIAEREADGPLTPVDLVVVEGAIASEKEIPLLSAWGKIGERARIPVIASIGPALLSVKDETEIDRTARRGDIGEMLVPALRELAKTDDARWLVLAANPAFARTAYGVARGAIAFEDKAQPSDLPSLSGAALIGYLAAVSHTKTGWATRIQGVPDGMVDDLPVVVQGEGDIDDRVSVPLRGIVGESVSKAFARAGIALPACVPNRDTAVFFSIPMLHAERGEAKTTLADQLFLRRLAEAFELLAQAIPDGADTKAVEETATIVLAQLFAGQRPIPEVGVAVDKGKLVLMCRPNRFMGVNINRIDLAASLNR